MAKPQYGAAHRQLRERLSPIVRLGMSKCCLCGEHITTEQWAMNAWVLEHAPNRVDYRGVAHAHCNNSDGARRGNARRRRTIRD